VNSQKQAFVQKPAINIECTKIDCKIISVGDTPVALSLQDLGDSCFRTFREAEIEEQSNTKSCPMNEQVCFVLSLFYKEVEGE